MSEMSLTAVLYRMGKGDITVHGFRSTFRDWCADYASNGCSREVCEQALADKLPDRVEAATAAAISRQALYVDGRVGSISPGWALRPGLGYSMVNETTGRAGHRVAPLALPLPAVPAWQKPRHRQRSGYTASAENRLAGTGSEKLVCHPYSLIQRINAACS